MMNWYACRSKTRKEQLLSEQLRIRKFDVFFPYLRVRPVNPRSRKIQPYFPGYIFARIDLEATKLSMIDSMPGAIGLVSFGGEPAPVPDHLILVLSRHLEILNAVQADMTERFQKGDIVAIQGGLFAGYDAIFNSRLPGHNRVEVLLNLLHGTHIKVQLPIEQIALRKSPSLTGKRQ
jgi:transcriptional antiterminator RfaH